MCVLSTMYAFGAYWIHVHGEQCISPTLALLILHSNLNYTQYTLYLLYSVVSSNGEWRMANGECRMPFGMRQGFRESKRELASIEHSNTIHRVIE